MKPFLPPPVTPSEVRNRSPRAAGKAFVDRIEEQHLSSESVRLETISPPLMTPSGEEPIGMGGR
jgi:hypothetical protein